MAQAWPCAFLIAGCLVASGCRQAASEEGWQEDSALPQSLGVETRDIDIGPRVAWFSFFDDPELEGLVAKALESNPSLAAARERIAQAQARAELAGASFWPTLSASIEAQRTRAPLTGAGFGGGQSPQDPGSPDQSPPPGVQDGEAIRFDRFRASLAASYEIDLWGRLSSQQRAAVVAAQAAEESMLAASMTLAANLSEAWLNAILAERRLQALRAQAEVSRSMLELTERRLAMGQGSALEVARQDQQHASVLERIAREKAQLATAKAQVALLAGMPPQSAELDLRNDFPELPDVPEPGLPADLIYRRPDVLAAARALQAEEQRTAAVVAERLPALQLQGNLFAQAQAWENLFEDLFWSVAASISEELFDGGREQARIAEQEALARERLFDLRDTLLTALGEVATTAAQYAQQQDALALLRKQAESAENATELARLQFAQGAIPYIQVLDALRTSQQVELSLIDAKRRALALHVQLCRALGGDWPATLDPQRASEKSDEQT